jgi:hypothetical protein
MSRSDHKIMDEPTKEWEQVSMAGLGFREVEIRLSVVAHTYNP